MRANLSALVSSPSCARFFLLSLALPVLHFIAPFMTDFTAFLLPEAFNATDEDAFIAFPMMSVIFE
jgi:hypothetical protein